MSNRWGWGVRIIGAIMAGLLLWPLTAPTAHAETLVCKCPPTTACGPVFTENKLNLAVSQLEAM